MPPVLLIKPLSLYWKMVINDKMNTYPAGRPVLRPRGTLVTTSRGLLGTYDLTVGDFCCLTMIRDSDGYVNDNIINAFMQTLDQAVRRAASGPATPPTQVFLSSYAATTLEQSRAKLRSHLGNTVWTLRIWRASEAFISRYIWRWMNRIPATGFLQFGTHTAMP